MFMMFWKSRDTDSLMNKGSGLNINETLESSPLKQKNVGKLSRILNFCIVRRRAFDYNKGIG